MAGIGISEQTLDHINIRPKFFLKISSARPQGKVCKILTVASGSLSNNRRGRSCHSRRSQVTKNGTPYGFTDLPTKGITNRGKEMSKSFYSVKCASPTSPPSLKKTTALLRYSSLSTHFPHLKGTIQQFLVYS